MLKTSSILVAGSLAAALGLAACGKQEKFSGNASPKDSSLGTTNQKLPDNYEGYLSVNAALIKGKLTSDSGEAARNCPKIKKLPDYLIGTYRLEEDSPASKGLCLNR